MVGLDWLYHYPPQEQLHLLLLLLLLLPALLQASP
jgi:hypothetical protein